MKTILVFSLPGSGKTTLGNKLAQKLDCDHLNVGHVKETFNDWDFYVNLLLFCNVYVSLTFDLYETRNYTHLTLFVTFLRNVVLILDGIMMLILIIYFAKVIYKGKIMLNIEIKK